MKTSPRLAPLALIAVLMSGAAGAAWAQVATPAAADSAFRATTLNLSAHGEVKAEPDMATISFGVTEQAPTAQAAMAANRTRMVQVIAALKRGGVAERDIQTSSLSLNPQYTYADNQPPKLNGYQASNQVTVTVNDVARVGVAIDAVVAAGANTMGGIAFGLKDPSAAENEARRLAVKALQAKADLYAQATAYRVSRLVNLSEGGGYSPSPQPMPMYAMRAEKAAPTPVQAGQLNVRVDVTGLYELAR